MGTSVKPETSQDEQSPAGGTSASTNDPLDDFYKSVPVAQPQEGAQATPVGGLWETIKRRSGVRDLLPAMGRGATGVVNAAGQVGAQVVAGTVNMARKDAPAVEESRRKKAKDFKLVPDETQDAIFGPRSDSQVFRLIEGLTQGAVAYAVARRVGLHGSALKNASAGAVVDAFGFDPHEAGISELAAKYGESIPGIGKAVKWVGELGSVDEDDSATKARLKRVIEGGVFGTILSKTFDAAIWGTRRFRAAKVIADPAASVAEQAKALEVVTKADKVLDAIEDGTYTPAGAKVAAKPNGDGTWRVEAVADEAQFPKESEDILGVPSQGEPGITTHDIGDGGKVIITRDEAGKPIGYMQIQPSLSDPEKFSVLDLIVDKPSRGKGVAREMYAQAQADGIKLESGTAALSDAGDKFTRKMADEGLTERADGPTMRLTQEEAEAQAASIDHVIKQAETPKGAKAFTDADVAEHFELAEKIRNAPTEKEAIDLVGSEDHFNLGGIASGEDFNAQLRALVARYSEAFSTAKGRPVISHETTFQSALTFARTLGLNNWSERVLREATDADRLSLTVETVLKVSAVRQIGDKIKAIGDALAARPHDPALMSEARRLLGVWHSVGLEAFEHRSELGRALNILGAMNKPGAKSVRFAEGTTSPKDAAKRKARKPRSTDPLSKEDVDVVASAKEGVEHARTELKKVRAAGQAKAKKAPSAKPDAAPKDNRIPGKGTTDVSPQDFSLNRVYQAARILQEDLERIGVDVPQFVDELEAVSKRSTDIKEAAGKQRAGGLDDLTAAQESALAADKRARQYVNPIEELSKWFDQAEEAIDRAVAQRAAADERLVIQQRLKDKTGFAQGSDKTTPLDEYIARRIEAGLEQPNAKRQHKRTADPVNPFDGISDEELAATLRLFRRSGGEPRQIEALVQGLKAAKDDQAQRLLSQGKMKTFADRVTMYYINSLISGLRTFQSIAASGMAMQGMENAARVLAGTASLNKGLITEGVANMYAMFRYAGENVSSAAAAFKEGSSVLEATPSFYMRGSGPVENVVTMPGRVAGTVDEFTRATAYRAEEFAKSLRQALDDGLSWKDAVKRAEEDVHFSIDKETGFARNPLALEKAGIPTLSQPLGQDTFMGKLAADLAESTWGKLIVPFMRPSVNTFRYVHQSTPGLNLFNSKAREIMKAGGEEAAVLHARSAIAGSLMVYSWSLFMQGRLTGDGPSNRNLRKADNRPPYSIFINGAWHSYRRLEPLASWLSVVADASEAVMEIDDEGEKQSLMAAVFGATVKNAYNKSWTQGLSEKLDAVRAADGAAFDRAAGGLLSGFVPAAVSQFNTDDTLREAQGIVDRIRSRTPGLSKDLPARYNLVGEPKLKQGDLWNRNFSIFPSAGETNQTLEQALLANDIGLSPFPAKHFKSQIDLNDPRWEKNGVRAHERVMELIREGGLRKEMEDMIKSKAWQNASAGTSTYPGGLKAQLLAEIKDKHETRAVQQMLREWGPEFRDMWTAAAFKMGPMAKYRGPDAAAATAEKYGLTPAGR